ncbi:hypothetical protein [Pseudonocardia sp. N23]|uniref:hypothetical protein n=1 Tax=Pseudonocardia sp. N23 TaxID=1987376 RepID=UPI000BFDE355|nr:hypothetical protein [Pseudonocardia sp. N23]GAY11816.1 hypothetical protein TOK_0201 [Pseudonocardia sp. N23]
MDIEQILIAVVVLGWIVWRQVVGQYASRTKLTWLPLVLVVLGVYTVVQAHLDITTTGAVLIGAEMLLTVVLGWVRGRAVSLETRDGFLYLRGGAPALVLWVVSIGMRVLVEVLAHGIGGSTAALATATIALSFGLSLGVQGIVLRQRIRNDGRPLQEDARRGGTRPRATLGR